MVTDAQREAHWHIIKTLQSQGLDVYFNVIGNQCYTTVGNAKLFEHDDYRQLDSVFKAWCTARIDVATGEHYAPF